MKIFIKHMVCLRCKIVVEREMDALALKYNTIDLGVVDINEKLTIMEKKKLGDALLKHGLELVEEREVRLINKAKTLIEEMMDSEHENYIHIAKGVFSQALQVRYEIISALFITVLGISVERYIICRRIEKVKEMLTYSDLSCSDIAARFNYSSAAHLAGQFKHETGLTPKFFRELRVRQLS